MSFQKTYAEPSFTSLGANSVRREPLRRAILADAVLTPAQTLEAIVMANAGAQSPESASATGRSWAFVFSGTGPLSGAETAALDAIVAAHTGVWTEPSSPSTGGSGTKVWGWNGGVPGWVNASGGATSFQSLTDGFAFTGNGGKALRVNVGEGFLEPFTAGDANGPAGGTVANELGLFADTTGKSLKSSGGVTLDPANGNILFPSGMTQPALKSASTNKILVGCTNAGVQDASPVFCIASNLGGGTNGSSINFYAGTRIPDGNVTASTGFYFANLVSSAGMYFKNDGVSNTSWREVMHVSGASTSRRICSTKYGTGQSDTPYFGANKAMLYGLTLAYVSGAPDSFTVDVGGCSDDTGVYHMVVDTLKTITCAVANLDTGASVATGTIYHVWLFGKSAGAENDVTIRFSLTPSAPTVPSGYNIKRRIGSIRTNTATTFTAFYQAGTANERDYWFRIDNTAAPCLLVSGGSGTAFASMTPPAPKTASELFLQVTCSSASMTTFLVDSAQAANMANGSARVSVGASGAGTQAPVRLSMIPALSTGTATPQYKTGTSLLTTITCSGYKEYL